MTDNRTTELRIGDEVLVHGHVDEIRKGTVIICNEGGYFGTAINEVHAVAATLGNEREKALEKLVQYALDEGHIDEWWYEDARKLGLEARY